jgi:hypothetical protein
MRTMMDDKEGNKKNGQDHMNDDDDDGSSPREEGTKRVARHNYNAELIVKVVSASFGPCKGRRLLTEELSSDETSSIPHTHSRRGSLSPGVTDSSTIQGSWTCRSQRRK